MPDRQLHEENRVSWNEATRAHNSHKGDQARFFREGGSTLRAEELALLGDLAGRRVLHLQCNSGQDMLSLARLGANVTGVDISDEAIAFAVRLSEEGGIPAAFHRADVYDWLEQAGRGGERFDLAFSSYGAVVWLSDLRAWARGIAGVLAEVGRFVLVDFHPQWMMLGDDWRPRYGYSEFAGGKGVVYEEGIGDYVAMAKRALGEELEGVQDFKNPHRVHEFLWGIGEIVTALLEAGLSPTALREYPYSNEPLLPGMRRDEHGRWRPPEGIPAFPLMYGVAARK